MTGPAEVVQFARLLRRLREQAGNPKYAAMGKRAADVGFSVANSSLSIADKGNHLPGWKVVQAYVLGCKGDPDEWLDRWTAVHNSVQAKEKPHAGRQPIRVVAFVGRPAPPDPTTAATPAELRARLRTLYERAGHPSLRAMEAAAAQRGLHLPRSTSQNLLRSRNAASLPRRDHLRAFLTVCGLPPEEQHEWIEVRDAMDERRRRARLAAAGHRAATRPGEPAPGTEPPGIEPPEAAPAPGTEPTSALTASPEAVGGPPAARRPANPGRPGPARRSAAPGRPHAPQPAVTGPAVTGAASAGPASAGPASAGPAAAEPPATPRPPATARPGRAGPPATTRLTAPPPTKPGPARPPATTRPTARPRSSGTARSRRPSWPGSARTTPDRVHRPDARPPRSGARRHATGTWRRLAAATVILATLALLPGVSHPTVHRGDDSRRPAVANEPVLPAPLRLANPDPAPAARPTLLALSARAAAMPEVSTPGRYSYVHTRIWSLDMTDPTRVDPPVDQELWWASDRSARRRGLTVEDFGPGEFVLIDTPSTDPVILAGQFDAHQPLRNGPQASIRAVADMNKQHPFTPAQIAAALRVLADTDGLVDRGTVLDRAQRPGVAISVDSDSGATRDVAVFDPASGVLLSYERVALIRPARTPVRTPAVIAYVLYLDRGHTDRPA